MQGSLINRISESSKQPAPEVGMGVTFLFYTDRAAGTIVKVVSDRKIIVLPDEAIRIDNNGMSDSQNYRYETIKDAKPITITRRKNGQWKVSKNMGSVSGTVAALGYRSAYHDYSF